MYAKVALTSAALACTLLAACAQARTVKPADDAAAPAKRVITLMPSFADELCALGKGALLAGVSQFSRNRACARNAPEVANFASVDTEKIVSLHPDAVLAIPAQRTLTAPLQRAGIRVVFMSDDSLDDIFSDIRIIGAITGDVWGAHALVHRLQRKSAALEASAHFRQRPSVFVVLQAQPIWTAGPQSYISTLLKMAGARNAVTALPGPYAQYSAEALLRAQPDAIVAGSDVRLESVLDREPWRSLRAVRENHVFILKNSDILERPGPNYNEGLSWLIEHLRPLTN